MRNPFLYRIGMESSLYGTKEFILWLAYAMWHAAIIYFVNFYALTQISAYSSNFSYASPEDGGQQG